MVFKPLPGNGLHPILFLARRYKLVSASQCGSLLKLSKGSNRRVELKCSRICGRRASENSVRDTGMER